ncbi:Endo/exonuclease/phosphatase domain-containing protein [Mycena indigotica]|uniref:Endo/exonuclease/phosphatase domain-containing protein n=1 Tax=Mycena indigotica TaxID=2126181 RepID=A0A8H6W704_9AGAR|nr:Endo/exonuclease/phosphatase domain-containing protein [Mycena indigotica]KAF7307187.1 Endo/exonuclease/phosphatase domain-containing protein [Mycena indigotica]
MSSDQLRVLTLNCWGLKYVAKNRTERVKAIAAELSRLDHDIIALQEIWVFADYQHVRESLLKRLPYAKFFYSGALGSGLALFSRFPILGSSVHPYSLNGTPIDVGGGDWFVGKAAVSIIVSHPILGQLQVFNTHLYAKGGEDGPEHNRAHRLVNAWEFSKLARQAAELGRYVIAVRLFLFISHSKLTFHSKAGDFNSIPDSLPMAVINEYAALNDSWAVSHPTSPTISSPSALEAITHFGVTADSPLNTYSAGKPIGPYARKFLGKRLDYILYRQPIRPQTRPDEPIPLLKCTECNVVLTEKVPGREFSYSDHFGLESTLEIRTGTQAPVDLGESHNVWSGGAPASSSELSGESVATALQALAARYRFTKQRARKEMSIFALCVLILVILVVGSPWLPHAWINPIFLLFTVFIAWLGTTMLYEGFLFGNWECNALMNTIEELEIYKNSLEIHRS